ncbi:MFS transporter [Streptococcus parauberis]|uniref:Transporter, major facilitator family protein n=1 Tax=Streptococcus parauberis NCFD 2020 TaxID=873447 RepID=F1Z139_9STRE|nr:MFS transporter [Streptococcus parauberis]EGE54513.1 transporter, major facilitator family protein [Streptococcus parauberis NCFD 2020]
MTHLLLLVIYMAFISLGLPDGLLGAGWPAMQLEMGLPVSYMGILTTIISMATIFSSLQSNRLNKKFGTGMVTAVSVAITAFAILGFGLCHSFWVICLLAIPYGLGAGSVDAALNNYVALHYSSKHMSWLHCMWGVGVSTGTYSLGYAMNLGNTWNSGYILVGVIQVIFTAVLFMNLPLWTNDHVNPSENQQVAKVLSFKEVLAIPGAKEIMLTFFAYCALESVTGLWTSSYMVEVKGLSVPMAVTFTTLFYLGITLGRGINGFMAMRFTNDQLIRIGLVLIGSGILIFLIPLQIHGLTLAGLLLIGLGCAPIYPCIIHSTPEHFGKERSQAMIGVEMAFAYMGFVIIPPLFGVIAQYISMSLFPVVLISLLFLMAIMHTKVVKIHIIE